MLTFKGFKVELPYDVIEILDVKIVQSINEHGNLYIKVLINEGRITEYINRNYIDDKIIIFNSHNNKIFVGKTSNIHMIYENGYHSMEISCVSYTKVFDIKKNSRTFCDLDLSYKDVISETLSSYSKKSFIDNISDGKKIEDFILQYEETDWQFLKRIATHFNSVLLSDCTEDYGRIYFGLPEIKNGNVLNCDSYEIVKDITHFNKNEALYLEENDLLEYTKWKVVSDKEFKLGEQIIFNNVKCIICKVEIEVYKELLRTVYTIGRIKGIRTPYTTNDKIFGMSIPATVKDVKGNIMAVHFEIDPVYKSCSNERYFTYAIESSAWYCMPEKESKVHIYFPTNYESDAIAIHAVRNTESSGKYASKTQDADIKSFSHTAGSEMKLSPTDMDFSADDSGTVNMNLNQSGDISITGKNIEITAEENIELGMREGCDGEEAIKPQNIQIIAKEKIQVAQGNNSIIADDDMSISSSKIDYIGTVKSPVEKLEEISKWEEADVSKQKEAINNGALEYEKQKIEEAKSKTKDGFFTAAIGIAAVVAGCVALAGATVLTGGLALGVGVAVISGLAGTLIGSSQVYEGMDDYSKVQAGDYSKSYNFVRDSICGGNETLYKVLKYGTTIINGIAASWVLGGASFEALGIAGKEALVDGAIGGSFALLNDFLDDGKINGGLDYYMQNISGAVGVGGIMRGAGKAAEGKGSTPEKKKVETESTTDPKNECHGIDPVNLATGSLYIPAVDIILPDIYSEFKIERKYESISKYIGPLGRGWKCSFYSTLYIEDDVAKVLCVDGHMEIFTFDNEIWVNNKNNRKNYQLDKYNNYWNLKDNVERKIYKYDLDGKLISITDKNNNVLTINYINNEIASIETFSNYMLFFKYKNNKIIEIKDELNRIVQYKYDGDFLTEVVHVDEGITRYTYDDKGYITSITDQNGNTYTKNTFDNKGRVIKQEYPDGNICTASYDDSLKETTFYFKDSNRVEKSRHNHLDLVTHIFYEDDTFEEYRYDDYQNKIYIKDRNNNVTRRRYDEYGNLLMEEKPNGLVTEYSYDKNGNILKENDNSGKEIIREYDSNNNLIEEKTKIGLGRYRKNTFEYDFKGRIISKVDGNGNNTKYYYDDLNKKYIKDPMEVVTASGYRYIYKYDNVGRNTAIQTDYGEIQFSYNRLNYVSEIRDANGNITRKVYDNMGNIIGFYPPNCKSQGYRYKYDHMDRLISIKDPLNTIKKSIRDSEGNIIKEVNPNYYDYTTEDGIGTEYVYDKDNRKIKTIYPDGGIERFFYDANGNVIRHISPEYYNEKTDDGLGYSYKYNSLNMLTEIINEKGKVEKSFVYDLHGNISKEIDIDGNEILFKYDNVGNLIEKRIPIIEGENSKYSVIYYIYDDNGNKICERHGLEAVKGDEVCRNYNEIKFTYDNENRLIRVEDKFGAKTTYRYDCLNNKVFESFKINDKTTKYINYKYDNVGNLIEKKEEINGAFVSPEKKGKTVFAITNYFYDGNGNIVKIITPKGYEIRRKYDEIDRVIEEVNEDKRNNILRKCNYEYDKNDNIIEISDSSMDVIKTKKYKYDSLDRLTHYKNVCGNTTRLFYDKNSRIIKEVLPEQYDKLKDDGLGTTYKYNIKGQVIEVKNPLGKTIKINEYDPKGNLKSVTDGENNKVEYTYTLLNKVKDITLPSAKDIGKKSQTYNYDVRGNITGIIDGNGNETKYLLDDWGRIIQIEAADGSVERYEYDLAGNIISTTDGNGNTIQYRYNSLNLVCEIIDQEGQSEYFYYDEEGNLIKQIDRNKNHVDRKYNIDKNIVQVQGYKLDEEAIKKEQEEKDKKSKKHTDYYMMVLNQIEAKKTQNNRNVNLEKDEATDNKNKLNIVEYRYKYNKDGTLKSSYFNNMEYQYKYNLEGMLESKSASGKTLLKYTYDKNNNIKTIKDISGKSSVYYYDENNRIKSIKDNNNISLAEYSYYNNDAIKSLKLGNGVKSDYTYDGDGNVKSLVTIGANGELLLDYKYAYDLNGNRTEKIGNKHKNYYSYDNMNRLKEARYDDRNERFTYDNAGNRLTRTVKDGAINYTIEKYKYNVKNQLEEIQGKDIKTVFTYDKQGNTIKEKTNNGSNIFEYNTLNKAIKAVTKEGNTLVSRYDSEGLRYEIEENEKLSRFIFHKDNVLVETDKNYNVISRFARGYEVVSADIKQDSPTNCNLKCTPKDDDLERYFYIVDEQGSTTLITNNSADIANEYYYDAFGNILESTEDIHNRITYTGQQFDGTIQQYYLRARFYNPAIGRFTQEDIYRGDGLNLYAYCKNNPVKYYDPSGYVCDGKKTSLNTGADKASNEYRRASLREIKRQLDIPMSQQPTSQKMVPLTDANGNLILKANKQPVMTRELTYDINGRKVVIQDHSAGHNFGQGGIGDQPSHHNVRPAENTRTGKVEGMEKHYYFDKRNNK